MTANPFEDVVARDPTRAADAPEVHAEARVLLSRALEGVQATGTPRWVVVLGEPGLGKTHLLGWLRRRARASAWVSPLRDARVVFRHLWRETVRSLSAPPEGDFTRPVPWNALWEGAIRAVCQDVRRAAERGALSAPPELVEFLRQVLPPFPERFPAATMELIRFSWPLLASPLFRFADQGSTLAPVTSEVRAALFALPDAVRGPIARQWLSGVEIPNEAAAAAGLAPPVVTEQGAHDVLASLLALAPFPLCICLDQIESVGHWCGDEGLRSLFVALMDLYHVPAPLLLLVACQSQEWPRISALAGESVLQRLDAVHTLPRLRPEEAVALTRARLGGSLGGFRIEEIEALLEDPAHRSPRALLRRLAAMYELRAGRPIARGASPGEVIEAALSEAQRRLAETPLPPDESDPRLVAVLRQLFARGVAPGLSVHEVEGEDRVLDLAPEGTGSGHRVRVLVLGASDGRAIRRQLERLLQAVESGRVDRGLVLRGTDQPIAERAQRAQEHLLRIEALGGGFVGLAPDDRRRLLALVEVVDAAAAGDLPVEAAEVWAHVLSRGGAWLAVPRGLSEWVRR